MGLCPSGGHIFSVLLHWLRSSVVYFAALDPILAEFKLSVILRQISVSLLES